MSNIQLTKKEKIKFVKDVFENESQLYQNTDKQYDYEDKFWLHKYITKSDTRALLRADLKSLYQTALNLVKNEESQLLLDKDTL